MNTTPIAAAVAAAIPTGETRVRLNPRVYPLTQARAAAIGLTVAEYLEKLVEEDDQRSPLPAATRPVAIGTLDPDECLRLSQWFLAVGGTPLFPEEVYANPETNKRAGLQGFIDYLTTSRRTRFRKSKMSTNEKTGWRLKHIESRYREAQAAGTLDPAKLLDDLRAWAREAKQLHP